MPRNGTGSYNLPQAAFVPAQTISSAAVNDDLSDIAAALTASVSADGQTPMTGPIKFTAGSVGSPGLTFQASQNDGFFLNALHQIGVAINGALSFVFTSAGLTLANGALATNPIGAVIDYAGATPPAGWSLCFGQAVSRSTYSALFTAIGTTYGTGDGSSTFNLPDLRGRTTAGVDNMGGSAAGRLTATYFGAAAALGAVGGLESHTLITAELPSHQHAVFLHDPSHTHPFTASVTNQSGGNTGVTYAAPSSASNTGAAVTNITIGSVNGVANDNLTAASGSGSAHAIVQPTMELNKIIFAGA